MVSSTLFQKDFYLNKNVRLDRETPVAQLNRFCFEQGFNLWELSHVGPSAGEGKLRASLYRLLEARGFPEGVMVSDTEKIAVLKPRVPSLLAERPNRRRHMSKEKRHGERSELSKAIHIPVHQAYLSGHAASSRPQSARTKFASPGFDVQDAATLALKPALQESVSTLSAIVRGQVMRCMLCSMAGPRASSLPRLRPLPIKPHAPLNISPPLLFTCRLCCCSLACPTMRTSASARLPTGPHTHTQGSHPLPAQSLPQQSPQ